MKERRVDMKVILLTNNITSVKYVGLYANDETDYYSNSIMRRAVSLYYPENFTTEVLFVSEDNEAYDFYKNYKTENRVIFSPEYYNIPETEDERQEYRNYIDKMNEEDFRKWREEHRYLYQTQEFRAKASANNSGELNPMYGKKHSKESKQLMSQNRKGLTVGEKNGNYGNTGEKAKNSKPLYKYTDQEHTNLVKRYNTLGLALEDLGLKGHSDLYKAIKNNTEYKGYYWSK